MSVLNFGGRYITWGGGNPAAFNAAVSVLKSVWLCFCGIVLMEWSRIGVTEVRSSMLKDTDLFEFMKGIQEPELLSFSF